MKKHLAFNTIASRALVAVAFCLSFAGLVSLGAHAASSEKVTQKAGETVQAASDYVSESATETKQEFQQKMRKNIAELEKNIAELRAQVDKSAEGTRNDVNAQLEKLESRRDALKQELDQVSNASGRAWDKMRSGMEKAWTEMASAYRNAKAEFNEKTKAEGRGKSSEKDVMKAESTAAGYKITRIEPGSIYAKMGLKEGDVILSVDGEKALQEKGAKVFGPIFSGEKKGPVKVELLRNGKKEVFTYNLQ